MVTDNHTRLQWSEKYSVGMPEIDEQHKTLFTLIDRIHVAVLEHKGTAACVGVLDELVDYTRTHFAREQEIMHIGKYPGYQAHCALHNELVSEVEALQAKIHAGSAISFELLHFLRNWLSKHILCEDKKYAYFFATNEHATQTTQEQKKWWKFW